jgi:hypothetical protein
MRLPDQQQFSILSGCPMPYKRHKGVRNLFGLKSIFPVPEEVDGTSTVSKGALFHFQLFR